jgi:4a-hydroxytetrahydrobiopterin dehydratase
MNDDKLTLKTCEACTIDAPLVTDQEIIDLKPQIPAWEIIEIENIKRLKCGFAFKSYLEGLSFVSKVATMAEMEDHHPEIILEWGKVSVSWWSHKIKGLHKNDFIAAAKTDEIYSS